MIQVEMIEHQQSLAVMAERWGLGDPLLAERLRRNWCGDPYDRRDWLAWFRRG